jgi:hypothetical protein
VLKLLLFSIIAATLLLPAAAARAREPRQALKSVLLAMLAVELGYAFFLLFIYPRMI